jgi:hypothetical protein
MRKFWWIFLLLASCAEKPESANKLKGPTGQNGENTGTPWPPSKPFPSKMFAKVVLFRLDSAHYKLDDISMEDSVLNAHYANGLSFIDSLGKPKSPFYTKHDLTPYEQRELESILVVNDSSTKSTTCIPFYRDVFVFYDGHRRQIAQAQICFHCGQTFLTPKPSGGFDERNWDTLQDFIRKVAVH